MAEAHLLAKNNMICAKPRFLLRTSTKIYRLLKNTAHDVIHFRIAHTMVSSTSVSSMFYVKQPEQMCVSLIDGTQVEETSLFTTAVDDVIMSCFSTSDISINTEKRNLAFGRISLFFAILYS